MWRCNWVHTSKMLLCTHVDSMAIIIIGSFIAHEQRLLFDTTPKIPVIICSENSITWLDNAQFQILNLAMAAVKNQINVHTTYYESFLALSVSIRVDKHQLMMETPSSSQAPVLRYRDITFTTEHDLKESLSVVCPLLGVARVRQGALPLVEVDFTDEKALERFCKSISNGNVL